jgi:hypothetical protein
MIVVINTAIARYLNYVVDNPNLREIGIDSLDRESHGDGLDLFSDETSVVYAVERRTPRSAPGRGRLTTIPCLSSIVVSADIANRCSIIAMPYIPTEANADPPFLFFPAVADENGFFRLEGRLNGAVQKGVVVGKAIVALRIDAYDDAHAIADSIERYVRRMSDYIQELRELIDCCRSVAPSDRQ